MSGLVYLDGKGFLYHSWSESLLDGRWVAIDPTYGQVPADPTDPDPVPEPVEVKKAKAAPPPANARAVTAPATARRRLDLNILIDPPVFW